MCLTLEEVSVRAGKGVLMKVDDSSVPSIGDPQGISGKEHKPRQIHLLNIIIINELILY